MPISKLVFIWTLLVCTCIIGLGLFYCVVCLVHVFSCIARVDYSYHIKKITSDCSERKKKMTRVHCVIVEYVPDASEIACDVEHIIFMNSVPDGIEIAD
jgi:hypothetical protein